MIKLRILKREKKVLVLLMIIVIGFIGIGGALFVRYRIFNNEVINLANEEISSVTKIDNTKSAVGIKIETTETGISKTYIYRDYNNSFAKNIYNYYLMLCDKENFELIKVSKKITENSGELELGKKSQEEGKIIVIDICYGDKGYEIKYRKDIGVINKINN